MLVRRLASSFAALAIIAASSLVLTAPATAAAPAGATYVSGADLVLFSDFDNVGWGVTSSHIPTSTVRGLELENTAALHYGFSSTMATFGGSTLRGVANSSFFFVSDDSDVVAEMTWYSDAAHTGENFLFADQPGSAAFTDPTALWRSSAAVGAIPALTTATLDDFDAQFAVDPTLTDASLKGVGLYNNGATVFLTSFPAGGSLFYFTPVPVSTAAAAVGQVDFGTAGRGYTATTTGFVPGETVSVYLNTTEATSDPIDIVADSNGAVTYTWVAPLTTMEVGTYAVNFTTQFTSGLLQIFAFDVVAQVAAPAALAASGTDSAVPFAVGGALLMGGVAAGLFARKRRSAPSR